MARNEIFKSNMDAVTVLSIWGHRQRADIVYYLKKGFNSKLESQPQSRPIILEGQQSGLEKMKQLCSLLVWKYFTFDWLQKLSPLWHQETRLKITMTEVIQHDLRITKEILFSLQALLYSKAITSLIGLITNVKTFFEKLNSWPCL